MGLMSGRSGLLRGRGAAWLRWRLAWLAWRFRPQLVIVVVLVISAGLWAVVGGIGYGLWLLAMALLDWLVGVLG